MEEEKSTNPEEEKNENLPQEGEEQAASEDKAEEATEEAQPVSGGYTQEASQMFSSGLNLGFINEKVMKTRDEIGKFVIGQKDMVDLLMISIFSNGHVLLEGVPGVAKTLTAKVLSKTLSVDFGRIQFTPDLMPSDVIGTSVYNLQNSEFSFKKGPIFSNIVLIDEINRADRKSVV